MNGGPLEARTDRRARHVAELSGEGAVQRHADEDEDLRLELPQLGFENPPAFKIFWRTQVVDSGARPCNYVRDAEPPFGQSGIVQVGDAFGDQLRLVEQLPEPVGRPGEMMARLGGSDAGVDADEQHVHAGVNSIRQSQRLPVGFRILHVRVVQRWSAFI